MIPEPEIVPDAWKRLGFSGLFHQKAAMDATPEEVDQLEAKLPQFVPDCHNTWLILRIDRTEDEPKAVLVRRDDAALLDVFARGVDDAYRRRLS